MQSAVGHTLRFNAAVAVLALSAVAAPSPASTENVFVEVNPSTVQAGRTVTIRASCGGALNPAQVSSPAFGQVTVQPDNGDLTATATIPEDKHQGQYPVRLICPTRETATSTIWVIAMAQPTQGPNTGGGALAGDGGRTMMMAGGVVIGAGTGLAVFAWRRRRRPA